MISVPIEGTHCGRGEYGLFIEAPTGVFLDRDEVCINWTICAKAFCVSVDKYVDKHLDLVIEWRRFLMVFANVGPSI